MALLGTEVKSIREGNVNLRDSFACVESGEVWIYNVHISPHSHRGYSITSRREAQALLRRAEIRKLIGKTVEKGMTLAPTRMYFQERLREGGDLAGQGQEGPRQARDDQAPRDRSRDPRGREGAAPVTGHGPRVSVRALYRGPAVGVVRLGRGLPRIRRTDRADRTVQRGEKVPDAATFVIEDRTLAGEAHRAIAVAPVLASRLTWRLTVPKGLAVGVDRMQVEAWNNEGDGVRFTAGINDGGTFTQLFEQPAPLCPAPATANGSRSAFRWRSYEGREVELVFATEPEPTARAGPAPISALGRPGNRGPVMEPSGPAVPPGPAGAVQPIRAELLAAIERVCDSQRFILGPEVEALEAELALVLESPHAITVSSGTMRCWRR